MSTFSTVVVFAAFGISLCIAWINRPWKVAATWREFAGRRGLDGSNGRFHHTGVVDGVGVDRVAIRRFEGGRSRITEWRTRIIAHAPHPVPVSVTVRPETVLAYLVKLVDLLDVQTGDPSFDAAFIVKASNEDAARELLDRDVRIKLQLCPTDIAFEYAAGVVEAHWRGTEIDAGVLDRVLDAVVAAASVVGESTVVDDAEPPAVKRRRRRKARRAEEVVIEDVATEE